MTHRFRSALWALLFLLGACAGTRCDGSKAGDAAGAASVRTPRPDLRLLVTTDARGYLEPCGCQVRPLGGLDKLATALAEARRDGVPTLLLSAGNFAFGTELRPEDAEEARAQERFRAETFLALYSQLGLAAVAPGPLDLAQDASLMRDLAGHARFPFVVDNLAAPAEAGSPLLGGARIIDVQGIKVGVLGLSQGDAAHPSAWAELSDALPETAAAKSAALREQGARIVVALVSADRRTARMVASKGVDVVVMGGLDLEHALPPSVVGDAVLLHAGQQGQHLLTLDLGLAQPGAWEDASEWTRREAKKELEQRSKELRERIAAWEKDPKVNPEDLAEQRGRLAELERTASAERVPAFDKRWFRAELRELSPEVPGDAQVGERLNEHDKRVNEHNRVALADRKPLPAPDGAAHYAGSAACQSCHQEAFAWWRKTKHGNAYATLEEVHKQFNLNCVACHVTGYNQPGGSTVTHVENLKDVGCESCHGPGSLHNAEPEKKGLIAREVPESTCVGCHTHEHSDRFVYEPFRAMLIVPGHGKPMDRR